MNNLTKILYENSKLGERATLTSEVVLEYESNIKFYNDVYKGVCSELYAYTKTMKFIYNNDKKKFNEYLKVKNEK